MTVHVDGAGRPEEEVQPADHQESTKCSAGARHERNVIVEVEKERERIGKEMKRPTLEEKNEERTVIRKVPETILQKEDYEMHFKPKELSIGPIHARDSTLNKNGLKIKLAACYTEETRSKESDLYQEIKKSLTEIKKSFDEEVIKPYKDEELIDLLFLDGCAMLGFIHSYVHKKLNIFHISNEKAALIQQDLFLLENQIPFTVLKVLMGLGAKRENKENLMQDFCRFIDLTSAFPRDRTEFIVMYLVDDVHVHFLDLFRKVLLFKAGPIMKYLSFGDSKKKSRQTRHFFRSVQELQNAGIEFKPSDSLRTIAFHSPFFAAAQLTLPTLVVDNSTEKKFFNLVIFEIFFHQEPWITSYVDLLDLLVDNDRDTEDLIKAGILQNRPGTNADVANLINRIGSKCFAPVKDTCEDVKRKVEKHCRSMFRRKCSLWIIQVCHTHFSSPWTIVALVAATVVLALTAVQTYYTVLPYH